MSDSPSTVRRALAEHGRLSSPIESLTEHDSLFNAGLTSHATVNVMLAIEDHYDIEFPERFLKRATFESIASLSAALDEILAS